MLKILLINNNFKGSYNSNQCYYRELFEELKNLNVIPYISNSLENTKKILNREYINFSICLGEYPYDTNNHLYDTYHLPHYQWISDNPLKMILDNKSKNIKYIFIDNEFKLFSGYLENEPLILPLGYQQSVYKRISFRDKVDAILFPGQVRNIEQINENINNSKFCTYIEKFIRQYNNDKSYIRSLKTYFLEIPAVAHNEVFKLTNSFIRTNKRITVLKAITKIPVYIAGEYNKELNNQNIEFIGSKSFGKIQDIMMEIKYILNIDPNYYSTIHDRVGRAINAGSVSVSNKSDTIQHNKGFPCVYTFSIPTQINNYLTFSEKEYYKILNKEEEFIRTTSWKNSIIKIIQNYLEWSSV